MSITKAATISTTEAALLAAIIADPDDDTVRLAFADWLDEYATTDADRAQAAFIRVQIAQGVLPDDDPEALVLAEEARHLHAAHGSAWVAGLGVAAHLQHFRRGLLEKVVVDPSRFLDIGPRLFAAAPVRKVVFQWGPGDPEPPPDWLARALRTPGFAGVTSLGLSDYGLTDDDVRTLAESPRLANLEELDVSRNRIGPAGAAAIANAGWQLAALNLNGNPIGNPGVAALAVSRRLWGLEALGVENTDVGAEGVLAIAGSPVFGRLRALCLDSNEVGDVGAEALLTSTHLRSLEWLTLDMSWGINPQSVAALQGRFGDTLDMSGYWPIV